LIKFVILNLQNSYRTKVARITDSRQVFDLFPTACGRICSDTYQKVDDQGKIVWIELTILPVNSTIYVL